MSEASNPLERMKSTYHYYHWSNFNYPAALAHYREISGSYLLNKSLLTHDSIYEFSRAKNIDQMRFVLRPHAYFRNFFLEQLSKITRPTIYYVGTGLGLVLDKTASQTWASVSPYNATYIFNYPDRAKLYLQQRSQVIQNYAYAIDKTSLVHTVINWKKIWFQQIEYSFSAQKYIWDNQLTSSHSVFYPTRIIMDKSRQLALGHVDVLTDRVAELVGWFGIGFLAYNLPPTVRLRTKMATEGWANRTWINKLPFMYKEPVKFFAIKPVVKVLYNPRVLAVMLTYKLVMNMGQNIAASVELERTNTELAKTLKKQNRSITAASYYNDLLLALLKRSDKTNDF